MTGHESLVGLRVVNLSGQVLSAQIAGWLLAQHGAHVTVVGSGREGAGSPASPFAPGTEFVDVDVCSSAELDELLSQADVVLRQGGSALADGLSGPSVPATAVVCTIWAHGSGSERPQSRIDDLLVNAYTGASAGQPGWLPGPSRLAVPVLSVMTGLFAAQAIIAELIAAARTGRKGAEVETSLLASASVLASLADAGPRSETVASRQSLPARGHSPLYAVYECADGRWLQLGCLHGGFVDAAIEVLGISSEILPLRSLPGFGDGVAPETDAIRIPFFNATEKAMRSRSSSDWLARFDAADIPAAPVCTPQEYVADTLRLRTSDTEPVRGGDQSLRPVLRFSSGPSSAPAGSSHGRVPLPSGVGPLAGITVAEFGNLIAGPMAARCLAELGATVVKIEPLSGEIYRQQQRPDFDPLNHQKSSLAVDLKSDAGRGAVQALMSRVDAVVCNYRPGVLDRLGLGFETVAEANPDVVFCQISAFGTTGPLAHQPGGDPLAAAITGLTATQGGEGDPVYVYGAPVDYTSALLASLGVLLGLYSRVQGNGGVLVDTTLIDAATLLVGEEYGRTPLPAAPDEALATQYRASPTHGLYPTADGDWLAIVVSRDAELEALRRTLAEGVEQSTAPRTRVGRDRNITEAEIAKALLTRPAAEWVDTLSSQEVPCEVVRDGVLHSEDPELTACGLVREYSRGGGQSVRSAARWIGSRSDGISVGVRSPLLGQHTIEILDCLGFDRPSIKQMLDEKSILAEEAL